MYTITPVLQTVLFVSLVIGSAGSFPQDDTSQNGMGFQDALNQVRHEFALQQQRIFDELRNSQATIESLKQIIKQQEHRISELETERQPSLEDQDNIDDGMDTVDRPLYAVHGETMRRETKMTFMNKRAFNRPSSKRDGNVAETPGAFSVFMNTSKSGLSRDEIVQFDGVVLNDGNNFNPTTGIYTTPETGTYVFHYHITTSGATKATVARLNIDGKSFSSVMSEPNQQNVMGSNTLIVRLNAGQRVWIHNMYDDSFYVSMENYRFTTFSGYLLH